MKNSKEWLITILISIILLSFSIRIVSFTKENYRKSYKKYNLGKVTLKKEEDFLTIVDDIIEYLRDDGDINLMKRNFNKREVLHMVDVRNLFQISKKLLIGSLILLSFIIFKFYKKLNFKKVSGILNINYIFIFLLYLMIKSDFNKYFIRFHEMFFNNDLWILDPTTDLLLQMMPENFFLDMAMKIVLLYLLSLFSLQVFFLSLQKYIIVYNSCNRVDKKR